MLHLDGRTLEGGGQLVRNAVALSALTGRPITISNIRGNRQGKTGLKGSHAAAIKFIAEVCQGEILGGHVGSQSMTFYPRKREFYQQHELEAALPPSSISSDVLRLKASILGGPPVVKSEYSIQQHTAGSISLVFQALYPYLVYASSLSSVTDEGQTIRNPIRVNITGGTNVTHSPSFEYLDQVLVPNLRQCGLPKLSIALHRRGWSTGPKDLGAVTFQAHPLTEKSGGGGWFPDLKLGQYRKSAVTNVDITILAPDLEFQHQEDARGRHQSGKKTARRSHRSKWDGEEIRGVKIREYLEDRTSRMLHRAQKAIFDGDFDSETRARHTPAETEAATKTKPDTGPGLGTGMADKESTSTTPPIQIRLSEATNHRTHIYILLVAHMSNGFKIGRDALFNGYVKHHGANIAATLDGLVDSCVADLIHEMEQRNTCVDVHMRDQLVIFEALGLLDQPVVSRRLGPDERSGSLHTQTARWVCEQILGADLWGAKNSG